MIEPDHKKASPPSSSSKSVVNSDSPLEIKQTTMPSSTLTSKSLSVGELLDLEVFRTTPEVGQFLVEMMRFKIEQFTNSPAVRELSRYSTDFLRYSRTNCVAKNE